MEEGDDDRIIYFDESQSRHPSGAPVWELGEGSPSYSMVTAQEAEPPTSVTFELVGEEVSGPVLPSTGRAGGWPGTFCAPRRLPTSRSIVQAMVTSQMVAVAVRSEILLLHSCKLCTRGRPVKAVDSL